MKIYFIVIKIRVDEQVRYYKKHVKKDWTRTKEVKSLPYIIFIELLKQLELKENYRATRHKLIPYRQNKK